MFLNPNSENGAKGKDKNCGSHGMVLWRDLLCIVTPVITTDVDTAWRKLEIMGC